MFGLTRSKCKRTPPLEADSNYFNELFVSLVAILHSGGFSDE